MIASRPITQLFSTALIVLLIMSAGYVFVPAPGQQLASNIGKQDAAIAVPAGAAMQTTANIGDTHLASPQPTPPYRSTSCTFCNTNSGVVAVTVQLDAAPLSVGAYHASDVFSPTRTDVPRTMAQRQPDPLERPPAA